MIRSEKAKLHKNWKIVKEIDLDKELKRELEDILGRRLTKDDFDVKGEYTSKRRSISKKKKRK